ncbi:MAG: hypothetical protein CME88_05950 [Hirschia sp.]|nr:hypothetical protein [Hirschia sp.]MBB36295.1 hypothetical protein [Hirschia sp.]MBF17907.1 hypothetical protein [Hirschia sp.]
MNLSIKTIILAGLVSVSTACAGISTPSQREETYLSLDVAFFLQNLEVVDDPLNPTIELNTRAAVLDHRLTPDATGDQFLRANIHRESGDILLQGYVTNKSTAGWLKPTMVVFEHSLSSRDVVRVATDVDCSQYGCMHYEDMVFSITPEELDTTIAETEAQGARFIRFRIQGQSGVDRDGRFHVAEMAAMRSVLAEYKTRFTTPGET